jgi:UV DNA damage endonuclease
VKKGRRIERSIVLPQLRAHADMVDPRAFEAFLRGAARGLDFDVMLEAKGKDLALPRLREQLETRGIANRDTRLRCP